MYMVIIVVTSHQELLHNKYTRILQKNLEHCMRIPMTPNVRSLNLSNCVAICTYEVLRQQNYNDLLREEPHKGSDFLERED